MRSVEELKNIRGKCALVRVDFNCPIEEGKVGDNTKIAAAIPTIEFLIKKGAKVILMTHFGRPSQSRHPERSEGSRTNVRASARDSSASGLRMTALRLSELLKRKVQLVDKWNFEAIGARVKNMKAGEVLMLPNLRLQAGEEKNGLAFAKELSAFGQFYVNEAFAVAHRRHASIVGVPKLLPSYGGLHLINEVKTLGRVLHGPQKPFVVMMGGGKITDKIATLKQMVKRADAVLIGGALATHFYKAKGYGVGASRIEPEGVRLAKGLLKNKKIVLPRDVVVGTADGKEARVVEYTEAGPLESRRPGPLFPKVICERPYGIWDIGPQTILEYAEHIKRARTLIWNGPMGLYEVKRYSHGTLALGRLFAARSKGKAFGVIGGGETIDAVRQTGLSEYVDFISTGGGAMLEFLSGKKLPGIEALYGSKQ